MMSPTTIGLAMYGASLMQFNFKTFRNSGYFAAEFVQQGVHLPQPPHV